MREIITYANYVMKKLLSLEILKPKMIIKKKAGFSPKFGGLFDDIYQNIRLKSAFLI